jgi:predicted MFS family arabinose efflux permease
MPLLSDSFGLLLASRALYGIALGIVISLVTALVADFFDGEERIQVMGIQGASVGAGLMLVTALAGFVGRSDFHYVFYISILGFVAFAVMLFLLPDKPVHREQTGTKKKIRLNRKVWILAAFLFAEGFFIIMFTTNVAMHLAGPLKGDTVAAGTITSVFSAAQIVMGLLLRRITAITKKFTLPVAMFFMAAGYLLMAAFPASFVLLLISAVLCGYSQSVYCAGAMAEVTTLVEPESTPMAASVLTCALCISQFISPVVINTVCRMVFAETSATGVYLLGGIGIGLVAVIETIYRKKTK